MTRRRRPRTSVGPPQRFRQAVEHLAHGRFLRARRLLAQLADELSADDPLAPWACQELLQTHLRRGEIEAAEEALTAAYPDDSALRHHGRGYLLRRTGRGDEARACFEQALAIDPHLTAADNELGWMLVESGKLDEGLALLERSTRRHRRAGDLWGLASATMHRATACFLHWRLKEADELYQEAIDLKQRCGDQLGLASAHYHRACILGSCSRPAAALEVFEHALALKRRIRWKEGEATSLSALAATYIELGRIERGLTHARASLRLFRGSTHAGALGLRADAHTNLCIGLRLLSDLPGAQRHAEKALELLAASPDLEARARATANLSTAQLLRGKPREALATLASLSEEEHSRLSPRSRMMLLNDQARAELALGDPESAHVTSRESVTLGRGLAGQRLTPTVQLVEARACLGRALFALGRRRAAMTALNEARSELSRALDEQPNAMTRVGLLETLREADDNLIVGLASRPRDTRSAWARLRAAKAPELQLRLQAPRSWSESTRPLREVDVVEAEIRALRTRSSLSKPELTRLRRLRDVYADLSDREGDATRPDALPEPPSDEALLAGLDPETALLDYHVSPHGTRVFVVHEGDVQVLELRLTTDSLRRSVKQLIEPLEAAGRSLSPHFELDRYSKRAARSLGARLLDAALDRLPTTVRRLVVVPDGPLHALPFELLTLDQDDGRTSLVDERFEIAYLPSANLLLPVEKRRRKRRRLVAFAYSPPRSLTVAGATGPLTLRPLPGVVEEVEAIASLYPDAVTRLAEDATPERYLVEARKADLLHLAAHALADEQAPGLAGLVLAPESPSQDVGLLTVERLAATSLRAQLVTLSACETGRGDLRQREGQLSLARAFLETGAEAVLATAWPVEDETTRQLMTELHVGLRRGESRTTALASARARLRATPGREHPFYWASYLLFDRRPATR
ncbi:MAG: CHAT domain-containing protein [Acidobacteriota bacterium]